VITPEDDIPRSEAAPEQDDQIKGNDVADETESRLEQAPNDGPAPSTEQTETANQTTEDGLPPWEPLTPELVEDEAIRGDFMLSWAVILLAFLFGFTQIGETEVLVHVKTGKYIAEQGWPWLPPSHDVFSFTATETPWVNLSWLFDLLLAGVYSIQGPVGLTVLTAIMTAITFYFIVHINRPDISTWWGSICAGLTLVVCYPQFTARPDLATLLGLTLTLWFLHKWRESGASKHLWSLVPLFLVWSNLDKRMFLGLILVLLYALGETVGSFADRPGVLNAARRKQLWKVLGACVVTALLNPFGWNSLLAPINLYATEYPVLRDYHGANPSVDALNDFPIIGTVFWNSLNVHVVAGLLVLAISAVTLILNRSQLSFAHLFTWIGFVAMALAAVHELAAACVVVCVIGSLNAQDWYRTNFRQTYSVELNELLFSRGGRAITVLALFTLAFLAISGRLTGVDGQRMGLGFDRDLRSVIDGYRKELIGSFDDRPFNFRLEQGDVLIWTGQKVFVDNRVAIYAGRGEDDLLKLHDETRRSLRRNTKRSLQTQNSQQVWKSTFDRFDITHVVPRLTGDNPDYRTFWDLLLTPDDWVCTHLGAVTAVFYMYPRVEDQRRLTKYDPELEKYVEDHRLDLVQATFGTDSAESTNEGARDWPRAPSFYQKYLSLPNRNVPNPVREARHCLKTIQKPELRLSTEAMASLAYRAILKANQGLAQNPDSAVAFIVLGDAYSILELLETEIARNGSVEFQNQLRHYQILHAFHQARIIEPNNPAVHLRLIPVYLQLKSMDLALRSVNRYVELTANRSDLSNQELEMRRRQVQMQEQLKTMVDGAATFVEQALEQPRANRLEVAQSSYERGFVLQSLEVIKEDPVYLARNPDAQLLQGILLMQTGRPQEATRLFEEIERAAARSGVSEWKSAAALAWLANGNHEYDHAIHLWSSLIDASERERLTGLLTTLPLAQPPTFLFGKGRNLWPVQQVISVREAQQSAADLIASLKFNVAICKIETGQNKEATEFLQGILKDHPETALRPLIRFYTYLLTADWIEMEPPSNRIPLHDIFQPEPNQI